MWASVKSAVLRRVDTRKVSEGEWAALVAQPTSNAHYEDVDRRSESRFECREIGRLAISLTWTGRARQRYLVQTHSISRMGLGFLHSQEAHRGTRCCIALINNDRQLAQLYGTVTTCTQVEDGVYRVGVRFDQPVEAAKFALLSLPIEE